MPFFSHWKLERKKKRKGAFVRSFFIFLQGVVRRPVAAFANLEAAAVLISPAWSKSQGRRSHSDKESARRNENENENESTHAHTHTHTHTHTHKTRRKATKRRFAGRPPRRRRRRLIHLFCFVCLFFTFSQQRLRDDSRGSMSHYDYRSSGRNPAVPSPPDNALSACCDNQEKEKNDVHLV